MPANAKVWQCYKIFINYGLGSVIISVICVQIHISYVLNAIQKYHTHTLWRNITILKSTQSQLREYKKQELIWFYLLLCYKQNPKKELGSLLSSTLKKIGEREKGNIDLWMNLVGIYVLVSTVVYKISI